MWYLWYCVHYRLLNLIIQQGEHDSIIDAQATMLLYLKHEKEWEKMIRLKFKK